MPSDPSIHALRDASPRNEPGFDEWIDQLDTLAAQITATPVPARQRRRRLHTRRRIVGVSALAMVAAVVVAFLTTTATSPPSAYAAAKKALAATVAASSGTITGAISHDGSTDPLDTTEWNGDAIAVTRGATSDLGPNEALTLIDGSAYVEQADGTWLHYASESGVGPKVGPTVQLAHDDVAGNTGDQILSLATGLTETSQPDGTTIYTGTIPNLTTDPGVAATDDTILRMITNLRTGNDAVGPNMALAPAGFHNGLQLQLTVGSDGLVRRIWLAYQQQGTGSAASDGSYAMTITYSQLGTTPPISAPAISTPTAAVAWSTPATCTTACGG